MSITINGKDRASMLTSQNFSMNPSNVGTGTYGNKADTEKGKGTYHLAANSNLYEIQRTNNFEFVVMFDENTAFSKADLTSGTVKGGYMQEVIRMSVTQASIPHFTQEAIQVKRGNSTLKYAGTPTFSDGEIVCNDYIGADTKAMLMAWQNLSYDVLTEKVGLASDYKKEAHLIEYSPDLQPVRTWNLYGCWITGISEPPYSSEDNGKHTITVNISYDKAVLETDATTEGRG